MKTQHIDIFETFFYQIHYSARLVQYTWKRLMHRNGLELSTGQWVALNRLLHRGEMFQSDFVNEFFDDRPSVARMIASLEKKGLIVKEQDSFDKRKHRIRLSPEGVELHSKVSKIVKKHRKLMYKGLTGDDYLKLKNILMKFNKNVLEE